MNSSTKLYGWYSAKQVEMWGNRIYDSDDPNAVTAVLYSTPDGSTVIVTEVTSNPERPYGNFDDYVCLGEVVSYIRPI